MTDRRLALTTTVRVVDAGSSPSHAPAGGGPCQRVRPALPSLISGVLDVADLANGRHAVRGHAPHLTGGQAQQAVARLPSPSAGPKCRRCGRSVRPAGDAARCCDDRYRVGMLRSGSALPTRISAVGPACDHRRRPPGRRRQDVALFAVRVVDQRDARRAVRVVLNRGDLAGHAELVALEVDDADTGASRHHHGGGR